MACCHCGFWKESSVRNPVIAAFAGAIAIFGFGGEMEASSSPTFIASCQELQGVTYNLTVIAPEGQRVEDFTYSFSPQPEHVIAKAMDSQTQVFNMAPGQYTLTTQLVAEKSELEWVTSVVVDSCGQNGHGMTWRLARVENPTGVLTVGCGSNDYGNECNAYSGDTSCSTVLPILCIRKNGSRFPLAKPASVDNSNIYAQWSGGIVGTTSPTLPPSTLAAANAKCAQEFGLDWRVAEFHDGWGWYFKAYGNVGNPDKRFWVHINDQPANCWTP